MAGVDQNDLHEKSCLFGFSKCLHLVTFLVKKIFAFRYLFTIYIFMVQQNAAIRRWRGGKAMSPPALTGVATRRFAHFLTSPERSVSRVQRHSTAKKNSRPTQHLLFIPRRTFKNINLELRHKPQMPRFPS